MGVIADLGSSTDAIIVAESTMKAQTASPIKALYPIPQGIEENKEQEVLRDSQS